MWNPFLWLAGADKDLLRRCTSMPISERVKQTGVGALVLVSAVLGAISMTYAVSLTTSSQRIALGVGIGWGLTVLAIDRLLVSTMGKGAFRRSSWGVMASRFLLAIIVGIVTSHPLVLAVFDQSVAEQLAANQRIAVAAQQQSAGDAIRRLPTDNATVRAIEERTRTLDCLRRLQTAEQSGQQTSLPCGYSSGRSWSCGLRCQGIVRQIHDVENELRDLQLRLETERAQIEVQRQRIEGQTADQVASVKKHASSDYLARVEALDQVEAVHPHVRAVRLFIMLFILVVDLFPAIMKLCIPAGEYDQVYSSQAVEATGRESLRREAMQSEIPKALIRVHAAREFTDAFVRDMRKHAHDGLTTSVSNGQPHGGNGNGYAGASTAGGNGKASA